jgi:signal transduction histidine kinase
MTRDPELQIDPQDAMLLGPDAYEDILATYLQSRSEEDLYRVSLLSQQFIDGGMGPEDIIALHFESFDRVLTGKSYRDRARAEGDAQQFLLEVMIAYGVHFKEYLEVRLRESMQDAEIRADEEHQRVLDAERLGHQKDELLAVIAHELRTPITAARGNIDLARRMLSRGDTENASGLLEAARRAMDRLSRLSADLVEASRDDSPSLILGPLDLVSILQQACDWASVSGAEDEVSIELESSAEEIMVWGNEDALLSTFGNLLSNGVRYTPEGGSVTVRCGNGVTEAWAEVIDTGIGMSEEVRARIFDKFYRAPEARSMEIRGLGLGLSLVQNLVQAHHGRIEIESEPGKGTTMRVLIPNRSPATEEQER